MRSRTAGGRYDLAIEVHFWCGYGVAVLVLIHAGAALKHQFADRDAATVDTFVQPSAGRVAMSPVCGN